MAKKYGHFLTNSGNEKFSRNISVHISFNIGFIETTKSVKTGCFWIFVFAVTELKIDGKYVIEVYCFYNLKVMLNYKSYNL